VASCSKITYSDPWQANTALHAIVRKQLLSGRKPPAGVYPCAECKAWHLTSRKAHGKAKMWQH